MESTVKLLLSINAQGQPILKAVGDDIKKLSDGQVKLQESTTATGRVLEDMVGSLSGYGSRLGSVGNWLAALGPAGLAASAALGGFTTVIATSIDSYQKFATQVRDLSYLAGASASETSLLITALEDLGVESGTVEAGISKMSAAIDSGSPALARLGVSIRSGNGALKSGLDLFYDSIDALRELQSETERNALARELFGRGWTAMLPAIIKGSDALREMGRENALLGKTMTEEGIRKAHELKQSLNDLKDIGEGWAISIGSVVIPRVTEFARIAGILAASLVSPGSLAPGAIATANERARILENIDPAGRLRAALPSGGFSSDVGAWRLGMPGASVTAESDAEKSKKTAAELEKQLKYEKQLAELTGGARAARAAAIPEGFARITAEETAALAQVDAKLRERTAEFARQREATRLPEDRARIATLEAAAIAESEAQKAKIQQDAEQRRRTERLRIGALENKDQERLLDEYSILQSATLATDVQAQEANQQKIVELTEYYRGVKAQEDAEEERRRRETLAAGAAFDDTLNQMRVEDYQVSEAQIAEARERARRKRMDDALYDFQALQRNYDDDVQKAIAAELLKTGLWQDEGRKRLDAVVGIYDRIEARRKQDVENQKKSLLIQMAATGDYFDKTKLALTYHLTDWRSADDRILDITREFGQAAVKTLDDVYFNILTGRFENLKDLVTQFGEALLRIGTQELARATLSFLAGGTGGSGGGIGGVLGSVGAGALINGSTGGSGGGGGNILSGIPVVGLIDKLSGGALSSTVSGWLGSSGVSSFTSTPEMWAAFQASTAEASDLGLLSATALSNTGAAAGAAAGSMYSGLSAATLADISGAPIIAGAGSGAGAGATGGLAAFGVNALPFLPLAIAAIATSMIPDKSYENWARGTSETLDYFRSHPERLAAIVADPYGTWREYLPGTLGGQAGNDPIRNIAQAILQTGYSAQFLSNVGSGANSWGAAAGLIADAVNPWAEAYGNGEPWASAQARASGGPVTAGRLYRVNEAGTEAFVPAVNGVILSANTTRDALAGGGGMTVNGPLLSITVNAQGSLAEPRAIAEFVREKIQPELVKLSRMRQGPLFAGA